MNQKNGRTDPGPLRERARSLFISQATIDETLEWATPRQLAAIDRMLATELANREASKRARLMRQARFPVPKSLDGYDFANVRLPNGYTKEQLTGLDFAAKAQDLVFYGKTGRGKTHLATALGMIAVERGRSVRFRQTAELVLQLGKAKRDGALDSLLCLCSISCCGFSHDDFSGLGRACRPRNGLNWMVLVSPPERTGKDYDQHAPSTVYPSFAAERGIRRVDRAENTCQRADGA